jgi:hypothetical protein
MHKPLAIFLAGLLSGAVVAGGVGVVSAVTSTDAPIVACAHKTTGALRYSAKGKCKKSERKLSLLTGTSLGPAQLAGPKGETGAPGVTGETGPQGTSGARGPSGTGLNTIPVSFGSKTLIQTEKSGCCDFGNSNLYIVAEIENRTSGSLSFDPSDRYQLWLDYFDSNGTALSCGESCVFQPASVRAVVQPSDTCPVGAGQPLVYELHLQGVHANKPADAVYFSLVFRIVTMDRGTSSPDQSLPITRFAATPVEFVIEPSSSGIASDDAMSMAC